MRKTPLFRVIPAGPPSANRRSRPAARLILFTTRGATRLDQFSFRADDFLLFGRESAGVPEDVHAAADARVAIPLAPPARSLNVAMSAGIALWEALKQTGRSAGQWSDGSAASAAGPVL